MLRREVKASDTGAEKRIKRPAKSNMPPSEAPGINNTFATFTEWASEADEEAYSNL